MRIILIGQAAFAEKALEKLCQMGEEVLAVFCPPDKAKGKLDPVKQAAQALNIPVFQQSSMKGPQVLEKFKELDADLAVLAFVTQIVPPLVFNSPRFGSICFHPSLLPKYRGGSAINWTLINGDTETGISWFWVDEGIDTGPLLVQKKVEIDPNETTGTIYFNKLFPLGINALTEAIELIKSGNPPRILQDESKANYDPLCRDEHAPIVWSRPAVAVFNHIRGCDPQPGASASCQGHKIRFYDCQLKKTENTSTPGEILKIDQHSVSISLKHGLLMVKKMKGDDRKMAAAGLVTSIGLQVGDRFD